MVAIQFIFAHGFFIEIIGSSINTEMHFPLTHLEPVRQLTVAQVLNPGSAITVSRTHWPLKQWAPAQHLTVTQLLIHFPASHDRPYSQF